MTANQDNQIGTPGPLVMSALHDEHYIRIERRLKLMIMYVVLIVFLSQLWLGSGSVLSILVAGAALSLSTWDTEQWITRHLFARAAINALLYPSNWSNVDRKSVIKIKKV